MILFSAFLITAFLLFRRSVWYYRLKGMLYAMKQLYFLPTDVFESFMDCYDVFESSKLTKDLEHKVINYYRVLNYLCSVGQCEKMYIPPVMDPSRGVFANQDLFEEKMVRDIDADESMKVLDLGCGRGRVAAHVARLSGAHVVGINIDKTQLELARSYAEANRLPCEFIEQSFNDPLPFDDNEFDALYQIQAFSYMENADKLFAEIHRVLKPGAKISFLDWFALDKYDERNPEHAELLARVKKLIGAVATPRVRDFEAALKRNGFLVTTSEIAGHESVNGHQYQLIQKADVYFRAFSWLVMALTKVRIFPAHLKVLFDRLTLDADQFVKGDKLGLYTSVYQLVAERV